MHALGTRPKQYCNNTSTKDPRGTPRQHPSHTRASNPMSSRAQIGLHQELQAMHLRPHYSQKAQHRHTHSHPAISPRRLVRACARLAHSIRLVLCADILTARTGDECKVATCRSHAQTKANKATVPHSSLCTVVLPLTSLKQRTIAERDYKTDRTAPGSVVHPAAKKPL
jgi:hypothetical protein